MSDQSNQNTNATENQENNKFCIEVTEHEKFDSLRESIFIKSSEFGALVNTIFNSTYADYEGCRIERDQTTNAPMISLIFNHLEKPGDLIYACTKDVDTGTTNATLRRLRSWENRVRNGEQYNLTKEGKEGLYEFIMRMPRTFTKDRKVRWENVVTTIADTGNPMMANQQFTAVNFVDINYMAGKIYGVEDPEGDGNWIYMTKIVHSAPGGVVMNNGYGVQDFAMEITRIKDNRVIEIGQRLGFGYNTNSLNIIKAINN